ncbi:SDR family oxidoreductase [Naumannella halotolerans]|uniref:NADP-dependent 3-hydroxy acid dehydrogenase YdfG n=1 Tax=Naumannella halotolerans TaxID=993414 RepID=A0A4R7J9E3_9ACTN|nr:SDR family oxidoreductase [Naumannella halotolerans]TDT34140.1 NADP-dependent 3-hydroxy acid dehydrogenase YdfG [Naumannella halotolerans]
MTQTPEPPTATDPDPADASAVIDPPRPVALVTGGTRGIGAAIARSLAPDHRVLIGGRDARAAAALATELPDAEPFVVDLNDARATAEAVDTCAALADGLDVLVHSAGVYNVQPVTEATREDWRQVLETNLVAVADLTRLLLPALRLRKGMVVAINSGAGMTPGPRGILYSTSKYALRGWTESLREECRGDIRVTGIFPGKVDTDMQREVQASRGNDYRPELYLQPEAVAAAVRTAVDTPPNGVIDSLIIRPVSR